MRAHYAPKNSITIDAFYRVGKPLQKNHQKYIILISMTVENDLFILGKNIKELRTKNRFSIVQLTKKAKISKDTLTKLERGIGNPLISTLHKISIALKVKLYELFRGI